MIIIDKLTFFEYFFLIIICNFIRDILQKQQKSNTLIDLLKKDNIFFIKYFSLPKIRSLLSIKSVN
jgi:hypothetical protein